MPTNTALVNALMQWSVEERLRRCGSDNLAPLNQATTADIYRAAGRKAERECRIGCTGKASCECFDCLADRAVAARHSDDDEHQQAEYLRIWNKGHEACKWDGRIRWFAWGFLACALLVVLRRYFGG